MSPIGRSLSTRQIGLLFAILLFCSRSVLTQDLNETEYQRSAAYQAGLEAVDKGALDLAIEKLREALAENPTLIKVYYQFGRIFVKLNRQEEAIAAYQKFLQDAPIITVPLPFEIPVAHYELGKIYLSRANHQAAADEYRWLKNQGELEYRQSEDRANTTEPQLTINNPQLIVRTPSPQDKARDPIIAVTTNNTRRTSFSQELAVYLSDLFPKEAAEQYQIPLTPLGDDAADQPPEMGKDGVGRPVITFKEKARYTEIARQNRVQGTVLLRVVFSREGKVTQIRVVRGLPDGLTRAAIEAARGIQFQPATRDRAPIDVSGKLEYTFNLY